MENMIQFIQDNWLIISGACAVLLPFLGWIAKKTKNKWDDQIVALLQRAFSLLIKKLGGPSIPITGVNKAVNEKEKEKLITRRDVVDRIN